MILRCPMIWDTMGSKECGDSGKQDTCVTSELSIPVWSLIYLSFHDECTAGLRCLLVVQGGTRNNYVIFLYSGGYVVGSVVY